MKRFIPTLLLAACTFVSFSQTYITQVKPSGEKLWGYANQKGEIIIPAKYAKCYKFSPEGWAAIYNQEERQYYFINPKGESMNTEVKGFKIRDGMGFDVEGFKNGIAMIKVGEKWGYINTDGKMVIPAKFDDANDFNDGYASAKLGEKYFVVDTKGAEHAVDAAGINDIRSFSGGMAPYKTADKKFGFIGADGKVAIPAQYEAVGYFKEGLAWAKDANEKVGYINIKGEWVIKPQFEVGKEFDKESGLARVRTGDKWGYVNKSGEMMYVNGTESYGDFSEGLAEGKVGDKKGFYNNKGEWVIKPEYEATRDFKNGFAGVKKGEKWGVIDKQGNWVIQPAFDGIKDMELVKD
jgi:hypothetical protein